MYISVYFTKTVAASSAVASSTRSSASCCQASQQLVQTILQRDTRLVSQRLLALVISATQCRMSPSRYLPTIIRFDSLSKPVGQHLAICLIEVARPVPIFNVSVIALVRLERH